MHPYIDDMVYILNEDVAKEKFDMALALVRDLGLPVNADKLVHLTTKVTCLGITIDTLPRTISIDDDKLFEISQFCQEQVGKKYLSKKKFQSLLGKLFYVHKCVKPSRIFMNRMLQLFRSQHHKKKIRLNDEFF